MVVLSPPGIIREVTFCNCSAFLISTPLAPILLSAAYPLTILLSQSLHTYNIIYTHKVIHMNAIDVPVCVYMHIDTA